MCDDPSCTKVFLVQFLDEKIKKLPLTDDTPSPTVSTFHPFLPSLTFFRAPSQRYPGVRSARHHARIPLYMKVTERIRLVAVYNTVLAIS